MKRIFPLLQLPINIPRLFAIFRYPPSGSIDLTLDVTRLLSTSSVEGVNGVDFGLQVVVSFGARAEF